MYIHKQDKHVHYYGFIWVESHDRSICLLSSLVMILAGYLNLVATRSSHISNEMIQYKLSSQTAFS